MSRKETTISQRLAQRLEMLRSGQHETSISPEHKAAIVALVEHGATIVEIEAIEGMPSVVTIWRECKRDEAFGQALQSARVTAAASILDEAHQELRRALDTGDPDTMKIASDYVRGATSYVEKIAPKEFGTLVKLAGADGGALTVQVVDYAKSHEVQGGSLKYDESHAREAIEAD